MLRTFIRLKIYKKQIKFKVYMRTTIFYFTGTGNSLKVARDLAQKFEVCELIPIAKVWQIENLESTSEKIGFIFPLYYSGLPKIVYDFINKINLSKSKYFFAIVTSAGDINELPLQQLEKILKTKAKTLNAGFFITMPNNYIIGFNIHSEERQKRFFEKAINQIEKIAEIVKDKKENLPKNVFEKNLRRSEKINQTFRDEVYEYDNSFHADDNCSNCGICEKVCPVNNIVLVEGIPQWQHKCQLCLACINFCPEKSIQFETKTLNTGRYHHPEITLQEIINQKK